MIFLAQTDTTAGFLSKDYKELNRAKRREQDQPCVLATAKFSELKNFVRVPQKFKNFVRRAKKTTFIYVNSTLSLTVLELGAESFEKSPCSESTQPPVDTTSSRISLQSEPSLQNGEALEGSSQHDAETSVPQNVSAPKNKTSIISNSSSQKNEALALEISSSREPQEWKAPLKNSSLKKSEALPRSGSSALEIWGGSSRPLGGEAVLPTGPLILQGEAAQRKISSPQKFKASPQKDLSLPSGEAACVRGGETLKSPAIRVVQDCAHAKFLAHMGAMFSTSANLHGQKFDLAAAKEIADVIADESFYEAAPSKIFKISKSAIKKIR